MWRFFILCILTTTMAQAEPFRLDQDPDETIRLLDLEDKPGKRRLRDLAPDTSALAFPHFCHTDGALFVYANVALLDTPYEYIMNYRIRRTAGDAVTIVLEPGAKANNDAKFHRAIARDAALAHQCGEGEQGLLAVEQIEGMTTLSALSTALLAGGKGGAFATQDAVKPAKKPSSRAALAARWRTRSETDAITDQTNVYVTKVPLEKAYNQFGSTKYVSLLLRCQRNTTSVIISFDNYQVQDKVRITTRFDKAKPQTGRWSVSTGKKAAGLWEGRTAIPFVRQMAGAKTLVMRLALDDGTETYTFDLTAGTEPLGALAEACHWPL